MNEKKESGNQFFFPSNKPNIDGAQTKPRTSESSVPRGFMSLWWWVVFLDRKVWPLNFLFAVVIAPQPDDPCRARDSGQTAVLMFLGLSAASDRLGQHILLTHPPASPVDGFVSSGFGPSPKESYKTFPLILSISRFFLNRTLHIAMPHKPRCP